MIGIGNKPIDGGNYLFTSEEKKQFLELEPDAASLFYPWLGAEEFLNGKERWVLLVQRASPSELSRLPETKKRISSVRECRLKSPSAGTVKLAEFPTRFHVENFPVSEYLAVPKVSSERRKFIPIGFLPPTTISSDLLIVVKECSIYHFGILSSSMHNAWMRQIGGRLKSDYRYSVNLVYNNFPWAEPTDDQKAKVEKAAQSVLDARSLYPESTLASLYDPLLMPPELVKAHITLDRAVEKCYRPEPFQSDRERVEFLFALYEKLAIPLAITEKTSSKKKQSKQISC